MNSFIRVLCNQRGQRRIRDIICGKEYCIQKGVRNKEENVLRGFTPTRGNCETSYKAYSTAYVRPKHPRTRFTHFRFRLINHSSKEEIRYAVENLRYGNQGTYNTHTQPDRIGQVNHHERRKQCIYTVSCYVARPVSNLVIPLQILLFFHHFAPFTFYFRLFTLSIFYNF